MYKKRLLIFLSVCSLIITICLMRLSCMSLFHAGSAREIIKQMQILPPQQLPTIRGDILDRNGKVIAGDRAVFYIEVTYELTKVLDPRYIEGATLVAMNRRKNKDMTPEEVEEKVRQSLEEKYNYLSKVIDAGARVKNCPRQQIEDQVKKINDDVWKMRKFFAWIRNYPNSELRQSYEKKGQYVPFDKAMANYAEINKDRKSRLRQIMKIDLIEMKKNVPLIELSSEEEKFSAQLNFTDIPEVKVMYETKRDYAWGCSAAQIIGWVGLAQPSEGKEFSDDAYSRYLSGEVTGKNGIELICEPVLRGLRGEVTYNRDGERVESMETRFGRDVKLSIDIELQRAIEDYLSDPNHNLNHDVSMGAVVLDVESNEILALVSLPTYDLNTVRSNYGQILNDPNRPFENKAIYKTYPPGSSIKPVMFSIGIDERVVTAGEVISCPHEKAPSGWPSCWIYRQPPHSSHDAQWENEGQNKGSNAIRGSCNIYFSKVADRIPSRNMQKWLYNFGFGRKTLANTGFTKTLEEMNREDITIGAVRESAGQISSSMQFNKIDSLEDIARLNNNEKRWFGIGQGSLRTTVLQVANAMASIARGGVYKKPKLFIHENSEDDRGETVGVRPETLFLVRDGMRAVINERGGTAYKAFIGGDLDKRDVTVYGKTGSTEKPATAWFSGFAEDGLERCVTIAIVVEGGVSGANDAAPLGRRMIELCNELGYVGKNVAGEYSVR